MSEAIVVDDETSALVEVFDRGPTIEISDSTSVVEVAKPGYTICIDGSAATAEIEVLTQTKGDKGDRGLPGPTGERGPRGAMGLDGPQGREGPRGLRGFRGIGGGVGGQGSTGPAGPPGMVDSDLVRELIEPELNEAALIPIAEIRNKIQKLPGTILDAFLGDLAGDDVTQMTWSAGEDASSFVGSVTTVSMVSDKDYKSFRETHGMIAKVSNSMAAIRLEQQVIAETNRAMARQVLTLVASTDQNVASIRQELKVTTTQTYANALALTEMSAVTEQSLAFMSDRIELVSTNQGATASRLTEYIASTDRAVALIRTDLNATTTASSANAQQLTVLSGKVGDNESQISQLFRITTDTNGKLTSNWQVKAQVASNGRVVMSGVALGASIGADGSYRSEFIVNADLVAFMTQNGGQLHQPFIFDVANDRVWLSNVFIQNGSITSAQIGDLSVNTAKIAYAAIDSARIQDAAITNAKIQNGAVDNLKIGNYIQSHNFYSGFSGWSISKDGDAEFNNVVIRRTTLVSSGFHYQSVVVSGYQPGNSEQAGAQYPAGSVIPGPTIYIDTGYTDQLSVADPYTPGFYGRVISPNDSWITPSGGGNVYELGFEVTASPAIVWGYTGSVSAGQRVYLVARMFLRVIQPFVSVQINNFSWALFRQR